MVPEGLRAAMRSGSGCPLLPFRKRANEGLTSHRRIDAWLRSDGVGAAERDA